VLKRVSVLVRTFNQPATLLRAIRSICAQTYPNIEIVIVNDGGRTVTEAVEVGKRRCAVTLVEHSENRGREVAANTALRAAKGEYALFVDDDDTILPDHIGILVKGLECNQGYRVAYCDSWIYHGREVDSDKETCQPARTFYSWEFDLADLLLMRACFTNSVLFDLALARETALDERQRVACDWDFWVRMASKTRFLHIRKATYEYTLNGPHHRFKDPDWAEIASAAKCMLDKYPNATVALPIGTIAYLLQQRFVAEARRFNQNKPTVPALSPDEVNVLLADVEIPDEIPRNEFAVAEVTLENQGNSMLLGGDLERSLKVSYHWLDEKGNLIVWDGERSFLPPSGILKGQRRTISAIVRAPKEEGRYLLQFAVLQEGVAWFRLCSNAINHPDRHVTVV